MTQKKLSRKEKVLICLKRLTEEHLNFNNGIRFGFDAEYIATEVGINRSNASKELNQLIKESIIIKIKGKPVQYLYKESIESILGKKLNKGIFDNINSINEYSENDSIKDEYILESIKKENNIFNLVGCDGSLRSQIEQAKAAVIYPPKGLSTLIIGPTGVGKSIFAEYMYKYSLTIKEDSDNAPFIIFNCADYSDNQQLLLAQLFGYVKGAFTGADKDKYGIVHEANNGVLFLDKVHRLSAEGQEMLFLLMDKGIYRRLGEANKVHECRVMIIAATTEDPETAMLETFLRRIPVTIKIPSLEERGFQERMKLICYFFKEESVRIGVKLKVSKEVIKAFILYKCKGNIGQLKSDIQLICARAFLDYMTYKRECVYVRLSLLPNNIRESLYGNNRKEEFVQNFSFIGKDDIIFLPEEKDFESENLLIENKKYDLDFYGMIKETWNKLQQEGIKESQIRSVIDGDIQKYSYNLMNTFIYNSSNQTAYNNIVNDSIATTVKYILQKHDKWSKREGLDKLIKAIALHIQNLIERIKIGNIVKHPNKDEIMKERAYEYNIAKEILSNMSLMYGVEFPEDEAIFLATFLYLSYVGLNEESIAILVIMHGESTASSMVNVANTLLDCNHAVAINMGLEDRVQDILVQAVEIANKIDKGKGILILTDMGSILTFAKVIRDATGKEVKAIDMVSTPIVIEATRKALTPEMTLEKLYFNIIESIKKHYGDMEVTYAEKDNGGRYFDRLLIDNISKTLTFLNGEKAYFILKEVINRISEHYSLVIQDELLVKFIFHCSCMIERVIIKESLVYKSYEERISRNKELYLVIKESFKLVEETFDIIISDMEYANILDIFESQYDTDKFKS
ncbi:TPA: sigma 54-interacting transcriptional regulator [Clostridioides difficile]|nr:sigma 54-interacting transcriptional regulator [Clostridioides difficile]HBG5070882.1 sigma 54-interacting transcriptional regulator [Clostridioides difficile]HBG5605731.1 sigma 54-interacting transcriptional regulator [Clostridioides difficile]